MKWYERIIAAHTAVTDAVSHGERLESDRYFVWKENGSDDFMAETIHAEKAVSGSTDLFTKQEFDPWREAFEAAMDAADGVYWELSSIQYEEETKFWHYEWVWTVHE